MAAEDLYPVAEKRPDLLKSPSGAAFQDLTLEALMEGRIDMQDLRITPEALELQASIAEQAGRNQLAENLRRAAELVNVPDEKLLAIYEALRPGRSSREGLHTMAQELEADYHATRTGQFLREAAEGAAL